MRKQGNLFAILTGIAAGASVSTAKLGLMNISAVTYGFYASAIAACLTFVYLVTTRQFHLRMAQRAPRLPLVGHLVGSFFSVWMFWEGTKLLNASVASFLAQSEIVFILIFSFLLLRERLRRVDVVATLIILCGIWVVSEVNPKDVLTSLTGQHRGIGYILLSSMAFAVTEIFSKKIATQINPFNLVLLRSIVLTGMFAILGMGKLDFPDLRIFGVIAASSVFGQVFARLCFMQALRSIDLAKTALLSRIEPFVVALLSLIMFQDLPTPNQWIGGLLIIAGCVVIYVGHRSAAPTPGEIR